MTVFTQLRVEFFPKNYFKESESSLEEIVWISSRGVGDGKKQMDERRVGGS